jgi:hypothetical protein
MTPFLLLQIYIVLGLIPMIGGRVSMIPMGADPPLAKNCTDEPTDLMVGFL